MHAGICGGSYMGTYGCNQKIRYSIQKSWLKSIVKLIHTGRGKSWVHSDTVWVGEEKVGEQRRVNSLIKSKESQPRSQSRNIQNKCDICAPFGSQEWGTHTEHPNSQFSQIAKPNTLRGNPWRLRAVESSDVLKQKPLRPSSLCKTISSPRES